MGGTRGAPRPLATAVPLQADLWAASRWAAPAYMQRSCSARITQRKILHAATRRQVSPVGQRSRSASLVAHGGPFVQPVHARDVRPQSSSAGGVHPGDTCQPSRPTGLSAQRGGDARSCLRLNHSSHQKHCACTRSPCYVPPRAVAHSEWGWHDAARRLQQCSVHKLIQNNA